jgi:HK97 family phage prohead protease
MKSNTYQTKGAAEIKDISSDKRQVAVYLAKFDNIDSDNDMIKKGAFTKSIQERGPESPSNRKIAFLRWHDWEKPIGKFLTLEEDDFGLFAVSQLGTSQLGEDAFRDYTDGIIREHSIGFQYIQDKMRWIDDANIPSQGYYMISELKLYEGSAVTFGANSETNVIDVMKSEDKIDKAVKISNEIDLLIKGLANGKGSDDRLFEMEMKLKYLNSQMLILAKSEPFVKEHSPIIEPLITIEAFNWSEVINKF